MSIKNWLRKVLDIKPEVIEKTTFIYPVSTDKEIADRALSECSSYFSFSPYGNYSFSNYESDIYKCIVNFLGPSYGDATFAEIEKMNLHKFYANDVPEGTVVLDYMNQHQELKDRFYSYHGKSNKKYDLTEKEFDAYKYIKEHILDVQIIDYDLSTNLEVILQMMSKYTREDKQEKKDS